MVRISDGEVQQQWGRVLNMAVVEPVTITDNGHDPMVLMSEVEYQRLKRRDRRVMALSDFTEEDIEAIRNAKPSPESAAFDHELEE